MKKFIIGMTAVTLAVSLAGCGKAAQESALNGLSHQLDETSNAISSMTTSSPTSIYLDGDADLKSASERTQETLLDEQNYRSEILSKTAKIKNCLAKDISLSNPEANALKDLTLNLEKYTNLAENSKAEMNSSAKAISSLRKDVTKNKAKLEAKINRLENNSNVRRAYFESILNTLDQIENRVGNCEQQTASTKSSENTDETQKPKRKLRRNIDTYRFAEDEVMQNRPARRAILNNRFNPTRNTDTYGPTYRNIDSFGGYNGYNQGVYPNPYPIAPTAPYGNYNSNNFNRMTTPIYNGVMPVAQEPKIDEKEKTEETKIENEPRIETFETEKQEDKTTSVAAIKLKPEEDKIVRAH